MSSPSSGTKCTDIYYCPNGQITCPHPTNCDACYCPPAQLTMGTTYTMYSPTMYSGKNYQELNGGWVTTSDGGSFSPDNSGFGKPPAGATFVMKSATSEKKTGDPIQSGDQVYLYYGNGKPFLLNRKSSTDYEMTLLTGSQEILQVVAVNPPFDKWGDAKSEKPQGTPILQGDPFYLKWPVQNSSGVFYNGDFYFWIGGGSGTGSIPIVFAAYDKQGLPGSAEKIKRCLKDDECPTGFQCTNKTCVKKPKKAPIAIIVIVVVFVLATIIGLIVYFSHKKKLEMQRPSIIQQILQST